MKHDSKSCQFTNVIPFRRKSWEPTQFLGNNSLPFIAFTFNVSRRVNCGRHVKIPTALILFVHRTYETINVHFKILCDLQIIDNTANIKRNNTPFNNTTI